MQLHIQFRGSRINLPIAYQHTLQGLIYHALEDEGDYSARLHDEGYLAQMRSFKRFTFSPLSGKYVIEGKRIIFEETAAFEVRSPDEGFIRRLAARLQEGAWGTLGTNPVQIVKSRVEDGHLLAERAVVRTVSPIVVYRTLEDGKTEFFSPADAVFCPALVRNARRKWESLHGEGAPFALSVQLDEGMQPRKVPTSFKSTFITGYHCRLVLEGMPEVLDMVYQTGLGAKSSQGFGMVRPVKE